MIKVGIYGSATVDDPIRKQLLRLLLRHPDVDLRCVASPNGNTIPVAELHPVFAGETELTLERLLCLDKLDVLFVIDEENLTEEIREKFRTDPDFHLVLLGKTPHILADNDPDIVYGLPEWNRKPLVRGARAAVSPTPEAMLMELALLPAAKNNLLPDSISVRISGNTPLESPAGEAKRLLKEIQPSFEGKLMLSNGPDATFHRLDAELSFETRLALEEIDRIYREAYDDHNFVYIIPGTGGIDEDLRGSNKCLIQLNKEGDRLIINACIDKLTKGCTGNAVHIMDLFFGLHERTGLSI